MFKPYKNLKSIFVYGGPGFEFNSVIDIVFPVDEIIVRSYTAKDYDIANNPTISLLNSSLVNGTLLAISPGIDMPVFVNTQFVLNHVPIRGLYNFKYTQLDGTELQSPATFNMNIMIQLTFLEY